MEGVGFENLKIIEKIGRCLASPTEMNKPIALAGTQKSQY